MTRIDAKALCRPLSLAGGLLAAALGASLAVAEERCVIRGTYPFCAGECEVGETLKERDDLFPGTRLCVTGTYALCCTTTPDPGLDPSFAAFCNRYAHDAVQQATRNRQMKCGLERDNPDRWTLDQDAHFNWCLSWEGAYAEPAREGSYRIAGLKDCADKQADAGMLQGTELNKGPIMAPEPSPAPPPAGPAVTVLLDVEVYSQPGGNGQVIGVLAAGTPGVFLVEPCRADRWCHIKGNVPGGQGWVWSGPGYQSLQV